MHRGPRVCARRMAYPPAREQIDHPTAETSESYLFAVAIRRGCPARSRCGGSSLIVCRRARRTRDHQIMRTSGLAEGRESNPAVQREKQIGGIVRWVPHARRRRLLAEPAPALSRNAGFDRCGRTLACKLKWSAPARTISSTGSDRRRRRVALPCQIMPWSRRKEYLPGQSGSMNRTPGRRSGVAIIASWSAAATPRHPPPPLIAERLQMRSCAASATGRRGTAAVVLHPAVRRIVTVMLSHGLGTAQIATVHAARKPRSRQPTPASDQPPMPLPGTAPGRRRAATEFACESDPAKAAEAEHLAK